jgi:hypothetical protein
LAETHQNQKHKTMDWIKIEESLNEKFQNSFSEQANFKLAETVKVFLSFLRKERLNDLTDSLQTRFVENDFAKFGKVRKDSANSIEIYFKAIYSTISDNPINGTLANCYERFFREVDATFWEQESPYLFTNKRNSNPKKDLSYFGDKTIFGDKFKLIYDLRNALTHGDTEIPYPSSHKDLSDESSFVKDIQDCVIVYLYITHQYLEPLQSYLDNAEEYDFSTYLTNLKTKFREKITRFVHIRGKEDFHLSNTYVIEQRDDFDLNPDEDLEHSKERRGTVDTLRKDQVPEKRMILWGEAGMGKTTTLEYLAYQDAEAYLQGNSQNIPVYLALGLLTDKNISIKQSIFNRLGVDNTQGDSLLKQGKINLFLDAINEIPQDDNNQLRTFRQREIDNLLKDYPNTFIIITNRPQDTNIFNQVPVFILQKMDNTQIAQFLERNALNKEVKNKIETTIKDDQRLKDIIKTPFMLSRLIEVVARKGEVPTNKGDIIHEFIHSLYVREQIDKKDANFNQKIIHRLLRYLGYESLEQKGTNAGMTEDEVLNIFAKRKTELGVQIDTIYVLEISTQLGILEKQDNLYVFSHQEYQDYYAFEEENAILKG